ncbi:MAG: hypothetical protein ACOYJE_01305 [Bacteroidaceae bacterium]|jgi:hypothetical protein
MVNLLPHNSAFSSPVRRTAILLAAHRADGKLLDSYRKLQAEAGNP